MSEHKTIEANDENKLKPWHDFSSWKDIKMPFGEVGVRFSLEGLSEDQINECLEELDRAKVKYIERFARGTSYGISEGDLVVRIEGRDNMERLFNWLGEKTLEKNKERKDAKEKEEWLDFKTNQFVRGKKSYSIYDLPKGTVIHGSFPFGTFSWIEEESRRKALPNLSGVTVEGDVLIANTRGFNPKILPNFSGRLLCDIEQIEQIAKNSFAAGLLQRCSVVFQGISFWEDAQQKDLHVLPFHKWKRLLSYVNVSEQINCINKLLSLDKNLPDYEERKADLEKKQAEYSMFPSEKNIFLTEKEKREQIAFERKLLENNGIPFKGPATLISIPVNLLADNKKTR